MKDLIYVIPPEEHGVETLKRIIREYREIKFVSLMGIDLGGMPPMRRFPSIFSLRIWRSSYSMVSKPMVPAWYSTKRTPKQCPPGYHTRQTC